MAAKRDTSTKVRVLRASVEESTKDVPARTSMAVACASYVLNQEGYYYTVGKPNYSGGFKFTVYEGGDRTETYLARGDEPVIVLAELLEVVCGSQAVRTFENCFKDWAGYNAPRASETPKGIPDVIPTITSTLEPVTRSSKR